ncbi:MAG: GGDEF domain-containing protein [Lachnospiraceae bacterium]|nr:GGDEF domain-containing protein [Lachnospiraceae bacterium]
MYQKKNIALFISHVYGDYQKNLCQGVIRRAEEFGYRTEIYATNDGEDLGDYSKGEEIIMDIPNFSDLDGIIFAPGTYSSQALCDKLRRRLKNQKHCQVVEITEHPSDFPAICMENNLTAGALTEHLITVHQAKRICFLGIGPDNYFSNMRKQAYENAMAHRMLPVGPRDVYELTDVRNESEYLDALNFFTENGTNKPDAIVCYNDDVALSFWYIAGENGYEIPKDFALTGCDLSDAGQNSDPPLTTVTFPSYQVGVAAVDMLMKYAKGCSDQTATIFAEPVFGGSCGCNYQHTHMGFKYNRALNQRISTLENSMFTSIKMSAALSHVSDLDSGMDILEEYAKLIEGCEEFYLCLYSDWDNISSRVLALADASLPEDEEAFSNSEDDTMLLALGLRQGARLPECSFSKTSLLPEFLQKDSSLSYLVCPLFFENRVFGYAAMGFRGNKLNFQFKLVQWMTNITQLLQSLCEAKHTQALAKHLEDIYLKDVLTGLSNHHDFMLKSQALIASCAPTDELIAIKIDLDLLKTINEQFGHNEGDFAIRAIGQAILQAADENTVSARFSGDEFYILMKAASQKDGEKFISRIEEYLNHFNQLSSKPYLIHISAGFHCLSCNHLPDAGAIDSAFDYATEMMYEQKNHKTKNVLR